MLWVLFRSSCFQNMIYFNYILISQNMRGTISFLISYFLILRIYPLTWLVLFSIISYLYVFPPQNCLIRNPKQRISISELLIHPYVHIQSSSQTGNSAFLIDITIVFHFILPKFFCLKEIYVHALSLFAD